MGKGAPGLTERAGVKGGDKRSDMRDMTIAPRDQTTAKCLRRQTAGEAPDQRRKARAKAVTSA